MRPKTLRLNLLPTLDAILNAGTVTEAAESAHLTQPALSIALRKARAHFDDELIIYRGGRSELTELGAELRTRVRAALEAARDVLDLELKFDPQNSTRTVRIMSNPHIEFAFMPQLLRHLRRLAPHLNVAVHRIGQPPPNPGALQDVDIIFESHYFLTPEYAHADLFKDRVACLVWDKHPTVGAQLTMSQFMALRHATFINPNDRSPAMFRNMAARHTVALYAPSAAALPYMIVGTDIVISGISKYCEPFTRHLPLRMVPLIPDLETQTDLDIQLAVLWKPHRSREPFMQWLIECCREVAQQI